MEKFLLFTTGGGSSDPLNWDSSEAALYSVKDLKSIKPISARELDLTFNTNNDIEIVTLKIKNGLHSRVISAIGTVIGTPGNSVIAIADVDGGRYINSAICGVTIKTSTPILYYQKIVDSTQVNVIPINTKLKKLTSMTLANIHSASATVAVFLANSTDNWYILKNVVIPFGTTLILDRSEIDYTTSLFNLYVKLSAADSAVDVIIRS